MISNAVCRQKAVITANNVSIIPAIRRTSTKEPVKPVERKVTKKGTQREERNPQEAQKKQGNPPQLTYWNTYQQGVGAKPKV